MWEIISTILLGWIVGQNIEFAFSIADKYSFVAFCIFIYAVMRIFK